MRLLIVTQTIDIEDAILGFFHRWVEVFSEHYETVTVICLYEGIHDLPKNVRVFSLGKEEKQSRFQYIVRFYRYISAYRDKYDEVFVHMNPEYVILGGLFWRLCHEKIGFWYNHTFGTWKTLFAMRLAHIIFYTSQYSFTAGSKKSRRMPAGIDTKLFKIDSKIPRRENSIYFQGRLAHSKKIHILLEAFSLLRKRGVHATLTLVGPEDVIYMKPLREKYKQYVLSGEISFLGSIENSKTVNLFQSHSVSVNLTEEGNYDKTVLESLACGTPVVTSSEAFVEAPVILIIEPDPVLLSDALEKFFTKREAESRHIYNRYVVENHSLSMLVEKLTKEMSNK